MFVYNVALDHIDNNFAPIVDIYHIILNVYNLPPGSRGEYIHNDIYYVC